MFWAVADFPRVARTHKYSAVYCYGGAYLSLVVRSLALSLSPVMLDLISSRRLVLLLDEPCKFHEDVPMPLQFGTLISPKCELSQDISNLAADGM